MNVNLATRKASIVFTDYSCSQYDEEGDFKSLYCIISFAYRIRQDSHNHDK